MWPDQVSNPGPLTYKSGALPTALRSLVDSGHYSINTEASKFAFQGTDKRALQELYRIRYSDS